MNSFLETCCCGSSLNSYNLSEEFIADAENVWQEIQLKVSESVHATEKATFDNEKSIQSVVSRKMPRYFGYFVLLLYCV